MKKSLSTVSLFALGALAAHGAQIFYEGFANYSLTGTPAYLHDQNPSISPFNAAWFASNNFGTNANAGARLVDGLSFSGIPASGSAVSMGRFGGSGALALHSVTRAANPALTPASDAYFGSFLLSMNENMFNATTNTQLFTRFSFIDNTGGSARNLDIGFNASNQLFMSVSGGTAASVTSTTAVMSGHSTPQLIVFQILDRTHPANTSGGTTEQITAWVNPNLDLSPDLWLNPLTLDNPLLRTGVPTTNLFSGIGLFTQVNGLNHVGTFDEIRFATSMDVVIPEPSTYAAIFGLLALGFVAYRRRRG